MIVNPVARRAASDCVGDTYGYAAFTRPTLIAAQKAA
jgi:hypothetical protein